MFKFGLKLWSINDNYLDAVRILDNKGLFDYIELYVIPGSFERYSEIWSRFSIPYVIHAPHWREGVNLAKKEKEDENIELIGQAQRFADELRAEKIIVHPGIDGDINETARQLVKINDKRILVENKPYFALDDGLLCNGSTPEEISLVIDKAQVGFCMDMGHAVCAANGHKKDQHAFLRDFLALKPAMFHLSDGDISSVYDSHKHIGKGSFDLDFFMSIIPADTMVTVETKKDSKNDLIDYEKDVKKIKDHIADAADPGIRIRKAVLSDSEVILAWRNDEETRKMSFNQEAISVEDHNRWFLSSLDMSDRLLYIAEYKGQPIGMVRFCKIDDKKWEVSINLSPLYRGRGLGSKIIRSGCDAFLSERKKLMLIAKTKAFNIASERAFKKAGFSDLDDYEGSDSGEVKVLGRML